MFKSPNLGVRVTEQTEHQGWIPAARFKVTLVREWRRGRRTWGSSRIMFFPLLGPLTEDLTHSHTQGFPL